MTDKTYEPEDLHPGDILLSMNPPRTVLQYLLDIREVIRRYIVNGTFDLDAATPLIHWIICTFDQYHYYHASMWNGEKVVESRIDGGLRANDLSTYIGAIVDIYRYHRDGQVPGSERLPVEPLLQKAEELVGEHLHYGFDNAAYLAVLCVSRWDRRAWVDRFRDLLLHYTHLESLQRLIKTLFDEFRPQIDHIIEHLIVAALEAVRRYRNREGYVCSQTVAIIFNDAEGESVPKGSYFIEKPNYETLMGAPMLVQAPRDTDRYIEEFTDAVEALKHALVEVPVSRPMVASGLIDEYESLREFILRDTLYTPRDIAQSRNTRLLGRLAL